MLIQLQVDFVKIDSESIIIYFLFCVLERTGHGGP